MLSANDTNTNAGSPDALQAAFSRWKKTVEAELKGAPFDKKLVTRTLEGLSLQPLYTRADTATLPDLQSKPGQAPFLRGTRPEGYREATWQVAQEIAAADAKAFNAAVLEDLMQGQDSVVVHVGQGPVTSLETLRTALAGVELSSIPVHLDAGPDALPVASAYLALAEERNVGWDKLSGSLTADPLGTLVTAGQLPHSLASHFDSLAGWTAWADRHAPELQTIGVNGRVWGDAGATAVQELAFVLATATEYLAALSSRGVPAELAASKVRIQFAVGPQFFMEVAKFRAWRLLWSRVLAAFNASVDVARETTVHAATARWNKTLLDPHVNMLRVTTEALSAALGGCDSLHIAPFDEVSGTANSFSRRIARNVHTLLAEEFSFTATADPAGGSWYVEKLTDELARKAWEVFQSLQAKGGMAAALRDGVPQKLVAEAAAEKSDAVGKRRLGLIGTNLFPNLKEKSLVMKEGPVAAPPAAGGAAVPAIAPVAGWPERFEAALSAARHGATLHQLSGLIAADTPEAGVPVVKPFRASAGFEQLRAASEAFAKKSGQRPRVFLAKIGPALQHKARADFSAGFFAPGGFEVLGKQASDTAEAAAEAAIQSGAPVVVLCSTDETYPQLVPAFAGAVKQARPDVKVVLAGLPADQATVDAFRAAGVDEFIHLRANVQSVLAKFLKQIGVLA